MESYTNAYDLKAICKNIGIILFVVIACYITKGAAIAIAVPFLLFAISSRNAKRLFFWVMFLMASIIIGSSILPKGGLYGIIQRASLMFVGLFSIFTIPGVKKNPVIKYMLSIGFFIVYMFVPSAMGWWPYVSYLKLFLFAFIFMALIGTTNSVLTDKSISAYDFRNIYLSFAIFFIIGSVLVIPFPALSQLTGEDYVNAIKAGYDMMSLFQGVTNQPQALGPIMAMFGVLLLSDMLFGIRRLDKLYVVMILCVPFLIYKTSSRTAMASLILATGVVLFLFLQASNINRRWRGKIVSTSLIVIAICAVACIGIPSIQKSIVKYALKYYSDDGNASVNWETATATRQGLMDTAMRDFKNKPLLGNGFQVDERLVLTMGNKGGLILSAPVEKGVWITALLQEGGIIGFLLYIFFAIGVAIRMFSLRYYIGLSMFVLFHLLNLGEFTIFSMSGMGGFFWTLVFLGLIADECRKREKRSVLHFPQRQYFNRY